jgi:hypothetical protein
VSKIRREVPKRVGAGLSSGIAGTGAYLARLARLVQIPS